jgi:hypothetical protein
MNDPPKRLRLRIGIETRDQQLEDARAELASELLGVRDEGGDQLRGESVLAGARGVDPRGLHTVVVAVGWQGIRPLVRTVQSWVARRSSRSVKLEIGGDVLEVSGASSQDQARLIDAWIERHGESTTGRSGLAGDPDTEF